MNFNEILAESELTEKDLTYFEKMMLSVEENQRGLYLENFCLEDFDENIYKPKWLKSKFEENIWECNLETTKNLILDFNIKLYDNSLLSDVENRKLLNGRG